MSLPDEAVAVREAARRASGSPAPEIAAVVPLAGDASTRRYYRVRFAGDAPRPSVVVMRHEEDVPPGKELPFVNAHRYFARARIPVPAILHEAPSDRILVLEDLGDRMLEDAVAEATSEDAFLPLYEGCIEILGRIQSDGTKALDGGAQALGLRFDVAKFAWEIDFFFEHAVRGFCGIRLSDADERAVEDLFLPLLEELCGLPLVLTHRDYHSRNVMVAERTDGPLCILDFQDARMGNVFYDLASLLRDSYVTLRQAAVDRLLYAYRHAAAGTVRSAGGDPGAFLRHFDLAALQRNVKALGTFGCQAHARGKTFYLKHIPPTVAHIERNFDRNPDLRKLENLLHPLLAALSARAAEGARRCGG